MYCLYEKFESIQAVLNTCREIHNLEIKYKYSYSVFLLYSIQVFPQKILIIRCETQKYIDHRLRGPCKILIPPFHRSLIKKKILK